MKRYYPASFYDPPGAFGGPVERGMSRREALHCGALGAASWLLASRLCAAPGNSSAIGAVPNPGKAKAVIQVWMWGGPSHTDTFDPKPEAGSDYTGPLSEVCQTSVPGMQLGGLLPLLAAQADRFSLIRSMTHGQNGHETASYLTQTGRMPGRIVYPHVGAVVTALGASRTEGAAESESLVPPYIVLTQPQGRFSEAGFMGLRHRPFATGGDPNAARFAVEGIVAPGVSDAEQVQRRDMLARFNVLERSTGKQPELAGAAEARARAYDMMLGDAGKVFDLNAEPAEVRQRYGRNTFGQSCLAARRLVEEGVRFVTINYGGWDTHKAHFETMRTKLPELDKGLGSLISDLHERGLLESTIVWVTGEFGRTPKVDWASPWNGGRHHFGPVFSTLVAGGGFRGGQVVGESDARSESVKDRPVYPRDLIGAMYELVGIDPEARLPHPLGEDIRATPTADEGLATGGRLTELI